MNDPIQQFIQEVLKKAGVSQMPEDFKQQYVEKLAAEAQKRLGIMALSEMDEKGMKEFEKLMTAEKAPEQKELLEFFESKIPDFPQKVTETLKKFGEEFIQGAERLKRVHG